MVNPMLTPKAEAKFVADPQADPKLSIKILDLLNQAMNYKQLKKGINECIKTLNKGNAEIIIMASDADPIEILASLPTICEEKNVSFCFISSKTALGRACGVKRPIIASCITKTEGSQLNSQISEMKDAIEQLFI